MIKVAVISALLTILLVGCQKRSSDALDSLSNFKPVITWNSLVDSRSNDDDDDFKIIYAGLTVKRLLIDQDFKDSNPNWKQSAINTVNDLPKYQTLVRKEWDEYNKNRGDKLKRIRYISISDSNGMVVGIGCDILEREFKVPYEIEFVFKDFKWIDSYIGD